MLDYDAEADRYDETRGGLPRAEAAAVALDRLLPPDAGTVVDLAGGTGLVAEELSRRGRAVLVLDRSAGMLRRAADRHPGRVAQADATALPLRDGSARAVTLIWLLHLLPDAAPVLAECARVLVPGGTLITTVDKDTSYAVDEDVGALVAEYQLPATARASDEHERVTKLAEGLGLRPSGTTTFLGHGQGDRPAELAERLRRGGDTWRRRIPSDGREELVARLRALPDPDRERRPPTYVLQAFTRSR